MSASKNTKACLTFANILMIPVTLEKIFVDWDCCAAVTVTDGTMNSAVYQNILKQNVWPSVRALKLKCTEVLQQVNTSKSNSGLQKKQQLHFVFTWGIFI